MKTQCLSSILKRELQYFTIKWNTKKLLDVHVPHIMWQLKVVNHEHVVTILLSLSALCCLRRQDLFSLIFNCRKSLCLWFLILWCFPGPWGMYEQLWKEVSQRGCQVSLSQWTHQSFNTKGTTNHRDTAVLLNSGTFGKFAFAHIPFYLIVRGPKSKIKVMSCVNQSVTLWVNWPKGSDSTVIHVLQNWKLFSSHLTSPAILWLIRFH